MLFQEEKLRSMLGYVSQNSPYYRRIFSQHGIRPEKIRTLRDLTALPYTTKEDLQKYNDDFFCVPRTQIRDYSTTSGTLGDPVTFGLTDHDLDRLAYNEAVSFACAGVKPGDTVQLMTTLDKRFMAGLAYFLGMRKLGAAVVRTGPGIPELQWDSIFKYKPKILISVPSFLLKMMEFAEKKGIDYQNSSVQSAVCIGESLRNPDFSENILSQKITNKWSIGLHSTYASTEMATAFTECEYKVGGHHHPELIIAEIINEDGQPAKDGESGELVITTLGVEAMPLLRFRTGDILQKFSEPCRCGRTTFRLSPVIGRRQQMVKYKGTTLYPPAMVNALADLEGIDLYQIVISRSEIGTDEILLKISSANCSPAFSSYIRDHFRAKLRVTPTVEFVPYEELSRAVLNPMGRKPLNFLDLR